MTRSRPASSTYREPVTLTVRNLGGIEAGDVAFPPGITVLTGRNATNRTSLLRAFAGSLGGTVASVKSDADSGRVALSFQETEYTREFKRTRGSVEITGTPLTENDAIVDLFVAVLEDNPARRAVERNEDLRQIIMAPVDTAAIETRIRDLKDELNDLEQEIERVESERRRLPRLEERRNELETQIGSVDADIEELETGIASIEGARDDGDESNELLVELNDTRMKLRKVRNDLDVATAERDALVDEHDRVESSLANLTVADDDDRREIDHELDRVRSRKYDVDEQVGSLTMIVEFNYELLTNEAILPELRPGTEPVVEQLAPAESRQVECWTCGSLVRSTQVERRLEDIRDVIAEKRTTRDNLENQITELQKQQEEVRESLQKRRDLEQRLAEIQAKVDEREQSMVHLEREEQELTERIRELENCVASTETGGDQELSNVYEKVSEFQYERGQLRQQLDQVTSEIEKTESLPSVESLEGERDGIRIDLEEERARIENLEQRGVDAFNEHMSDLLGLLEFENIARVWIERKADESGRGRGTASRVFDLHVVRESADGTVYEDQVSNLSESEREVVGLVVALAGYLVHEVHGSVPFMLLDSLEAIDAERIARLVDYFAEFVPFLVVALLPEDAAALPGRYHRIPAPNITN